MNSSFSFLKTEYPELFATCELAEKLIYIDPSSSLTKSRLISEKIVSLIWKFEEVEGSEESQAKKIDKLYYSHFIPAIIKEILHMIRKSGNAATHTGKSSEAESVFILKKLFSLTKWFYETYEKVSLSELTYQKPEKEKESREEVSKLEKQLEELSKQLIDYKEKIAQLNQSEEVKEERKIHAEKVAQKIQLNEKETRTLLIDPQLRKAGWECDTLTLNYRENHTVPQKGRNMAIAEWKCGNLWADYALFVGTTLYGLIEAKKFSADISTNLHQSKVYATNVTELEDINLLDEWEGKKVPFLFSTNGREYLEQIKTKSGVWFLDVRNPHNHPKALRAWYSPQGLVDLYQRNIGELNERLQNKEYAFLQDKSGLNLRDYQIEAIRAVENKIINHPEDKRALLVMATGTGKTRTAIGLAYRLISTNRFRRILFMTDRRLLATQAYDGFKDNKVENLQSFKDIYDIKGLETVKPAIDTRIHFATVQSLIKRIFSSDEEKDKGISIDTYDCIIVDEAHRGYNLDKEMDEEDLSFRNQHDYVSQYKRVIEYFDAHVIGLTATPALHTTQIFGIPVHSYSYREAVVDGYLVDHEPPFLIKTKLSEEGILWEKGEKPQVYNPETNSIEELAELEDELHIEIEQFNRGVITPNFNRTVIQELVKHLDPDGEEKTLIFAVRDTHADMIVDMLYEEFSKRGIEPHQDAIKKITGNVYDPAQLTKLFKNEKYPNIAVTVDLLSTGVDVPEICNLVFMRRTNSRIYFEQMLGRATRLCPGIGKEYFRVYDAVRVYEALQDFTQMQTVSNPSFTFCRLAEEFTHIESEERTRKQIEQIVAKIQRKCRKMQETTLEQFIRLSGGKEPADFIQELRTVTPAEVKEKIEQYQDLWQFLDARVYQDTKPMLYSVHEDEILYVTRGYGNAEKPEDYIEGFREFIRENRNTIMALNTVCNKPGELTRESLKELKLLLDEKGYNETKLNTAWKQAKNEQIAADIIGYIRTFALDTHLVEPEQRIKNAIRKVMNLHDWDVTQQKWIARFEKQLLAETVLRKEDLNKPPFTEAGGYNRLNKIFNEQLDEILTLINDNLFTA